MSLLEAVSSTLSIKDRSFHSLVSETIPFHRDYQVLLAKERAVYRKVRHVGFCSYYVLFSWYIVNRLIGLLYLLFQRLIAVLDELEALKPEFQRRLKELNRTNGESELIKFDGSDRTLNGAETSSSEWPVANKKLNLRVDSKQVLKPQRPRYVVDAIS